MTHTETVPQDTFTKRLIKVCAYLLEYPAIKTRKELATVVGLPDSNFSAMMGARRNYPDDVAKRNAAMVALSTDYGVNIDYLRGKPGDMFTRQPERIDIPVTVTPYRIKKKEELENLQKENAELRKKYDESQKEVALLREKLQKYESRRTDSKPDKK